MSTIQVFPDTNFYKVSLTASSSVKSSFDSAAYFTSLPFVARTVPVPAPPPTAAPIAAPFPPPAIAPIAAPTPAPPPMMAASRPFVPSASAAWTLVERAISLPFTVALLSARLMLALPDTRPEPSAATTVPSTAVPFSMTVLPSTTMGSERFPLNVSPALFLPESRELDRTTLSVVPAGMVTVLGAGGFGGAAGFGLSAAAVSAVAGALESVEVSSVDDVSSAGAQAPTIARINNNVMTFQMRIYTLSLIGFTTTVPTTNTGSSRSKKVLGCAR